MVNTTLAALGGALLGAGLTAIWCRQHPRGDAAEVVRLTREMTEMYHGMRERDAELQELRIAVRLAHTRLVEIQRTADALGATSAATKAYALRQYLNKYGRLDAALSPNDEDTEHHA
jgi:hypothetical protein